MNSLRESKNKWTRRIFPNEELKNYSQIYPRFVSHPVHRLIGIMRDIKIDLVLLLDPLNNPGPGR